MWYLLKLLLDASLSPWAGTIGEKEEVGLNVQGWDGAPQ